MLQPEKIEMKVLLIVSFLCVQTYCINNNSCFDFGKDRIDLKVLVNIVERKCGNDKQIPQAFRNFEKCTSSSAENSTRSSPALDSSKSLCSYLQESHFDICLNNLTTDLSPCLSEDEIYIQQLLLDAYHSGYEELCGISGVSNFQYLYDIANGARLDCVKTCGQLFVSYGLCTGNFNIFKQLDKGVFNLNKQDICHDLESFRHCSTEVLSGVCNEDFSRLTDLILQPLLAQCKDSNEENNF